MPISKCRGQRGGAHMEDHCFRNKITWFSFFFSLLVIWVHSYNAELYLGKTQQMATVYRYQHYLGDGIGQIAVPGFFMISGYLFYRDFSWACLGDKWQRRIRSVLVPYILWNFLYYLGYVTGSRLPWLTHVVGKGVIPFNLFAAVDAIMNYTYNYVFWYLFQLILLILLAPALYPLLKRHWGRAALFLFLWWAVAAKKTLPLVNADALLYYSAAASLALTRKQWVEAPVKGHAALGGIFLAVSALLYQAGLRTAFLPCFVLCRLMAVSGLWVLVPGRCLPKARDFMCQNFFLYGVHFAFVRLINKAGARILPPAAAVPMVLYLLMPFLVLGIAAVLSRILRRHMPILWSLLNGGR